MSIHLCEILSNEQLAGDVYRLTFYSESISRGAHPGEFVHIRVNTEYDPLLRRPFSIHDVDQLCNGVAILYQVVGSGTRILAAKKKGEVLDVLGPLGQGFNLDLAREESILIAGGIGIAPFPFLARKLTTMGRSVTVLAGWKTAEEVVGIEAFESLGMSIEIATEDGSLGYTGTVVELLETHLNGKNAGMGNRVVLYACGPKAMLAKVARFTRERGILCQVSLEENMACGVGACFGCAVEASGGNQLVTDYRLVCKDGPVFNSNEVVLK